VTKAPMTDALKARLLLVVLCLFWGLTWPAMRIALIDIPPFTMRATSAGIGALSLLVLAWLARRPVHLPHGRWLDILVLATFNVIVFSLCTAFAQLMSFTGRVAILVYTMPIWASVLARLLLHEWLPPTRLVALLLCCIGMGVLIWPLAAAGVPLGLLLALGAAVSWAIGTIYLKWRRLDLDPFTLAAWQLMIAFVVMASFVPFLEGSFRLWDAGWWSLSGAAFAGLFGSGIAYFIWFHIIRLLPATTASLGALASPVIGVVSSIFLLGEIPTAYDIVGFALIFAASVCALLQPHAPAAPKAVR